ncbi:MAG: hypothetical protein ACYTFQ_20895 [Planctomycetota bacterium]|jgi:hypothetical protein
MASEYTWVLSEIDARWREITGARSTDDITQANLHKRINDYYLHYFPHQANVDDLRTIFAGTTAMTDDGTLALAQTDIRLVEPVMRGTYELEFYRDFERFFRDYPTDEQYITPPTLAVGTSDAKKVKNSAFSYDIGGNSYEKASAETAFSGLSTVPQNKYGAFALKINSSGTITITEADNNSTGYNSASLAVRGLAYATSDYAFMGFVTVISTDSGGFVPGTTELSATAVTATYTDGMWEKRHPPEACLVYQEKLWLRPKPDDIYRITAPRTVRGTALETDDSNALPDVKWGPAIALGDAILWLREVSKERTVSDELTDAFRFRIDSISSKSRDQMIGGTVQRSF